MFCESEQLIVSGDLFSPCFSVTASWSFVLQALLHRGCTGPWIIPSTHQSVSKSSAVRALGLSVGNWACESTVVNISGYSDHRAQGRSIGKRKRCNYQKEKKKIHPHPAHPHLQPHCSMEGRSGTRGSRTLINSEAHFLITEITPEWRKVKGGRVNQGAFGLREQLIDWTSVWEEIHFPRVRLLVC